MADYNILDLLGVTDPGAQSQASALADAIRGKRAIAALGAIGSPAMQALGSQYAKDAESESDILRVASGQRAGLDNQRVLAGITDAMHRAQLAEQARHNRANESMARSELGARTPGAGRKQLVYGEGGGAFWADPTNPSAPATPVVGPEGAQIRKPGLALETQGSPGVKLTEVQAKAFSAVSRIREARKQMESAGYPTGLMGRKDAWATKASGGVMGAITPQEAASGAGQQYFTAARNLIAALLRKESGAAITKDEWEQLGPLYVPMPWDSDQTRAQKLKMLDVMEESAVVESGPGGAAALAKKGKQAPQNDPLGVR